MRAGLLFLSLLFIPAAPGAAGVSTEVRMGGAYGVGVLNRYLPSYNIGLTVLVDKGEGPAVGLYADGALNHVRKEQDQFGLAGAERFDSRINSGSLGILLRHPLTPESPLRLHWILGAGAYQISTWERCIDRTAGNGCAASESQRRISTSNYLGLSTGLQLRIGPVGAEVRFHQLLGNGHVSSPTYIVPSLVFSNSFK